MRHIVIGTSGHIDHGKTALIKAITGFEGDTLEEEKKRGITIDLSFSNFVQNGVNVSFIDVPGHEKLIKNMVAGAFGFDAAMLVVDVNEGIMPQTIEHIHILNILGVKNLIVALSKCDLANRQKIAEQKEAIKEFIKGFKNLNLLEIVETSIYNQESIENLKKILINIPSVSKKSRGFFRYYVDRSFSLKGIGRVVTGTILDGSLKVGEKIFDTSSKKEIIVKNLQVHNRDVEVATISQRVAINLNTKDNIAKGTLLSKKGFLRAFNKVDCYFEAIEGKELRHNIKVQFLVGTKAVEAKALLFDADIESIKSGFVSFEFIEPIALVYNEPYIVLNSGRVIGGGRVLSPINDPLKKRTKYELLAALKEQNLKRAFELLLKQHKKGFGLISSNQRFGIGHQEALEIAKSIESIFIDEKNLVLYPIEIKNELERIILDIYKKNPYAMLSAKSLSIKLIWASEGFVESVLKELESAKIVRFKEGVYINANSNIKDINTLIEEKIFNAITKDGIKPQAPYNIYDSLDIDRKLGDKALKKLTSAKKITRLTHNLFINTETVINLVKELKEIIKKEGYIDLQLFKENYPNLSRKYLIAYLEYLDKISDIKKEGNRRVLIGRG